MNTTNIIMSNRIRGARIGLHWVRVSAVAVLICGSSWHSQADDAKTALAAAPVTAPASAAKESRLTADQALQRLIQGNGRYVAGAPTHPDQTPQRRAELAKGQSPFAIVLTCSDSRVAPELFLDQGLGDLFVIRNAGNILDDHVIGSIEYAVEQAKNLPGDKVDNAVRANAQRAAEILTRVEPILKEAVSSGKLLVVPARYELATGRLEILKEATQTAPKH